MIFLLFWFGSGLAAELDLIATLRNRTTRVAMPCELIATIRFDVASADRGASRVGSDA